MVFMRYKDGGACENTGDPVEEHKFFTGEDEEIIHGFIFYYPSIPMLKIVEVAIEKQKDLEDLDDFADNICRILYVLNEKTKVIETQKKGSKQRIHDKQMRVIRNYMIDTTQAIILSVDNVAEIFSGEE